MRTAHTPTHMMPEPSADGNGHRPGAALRRAPSIDTLRAARLALAEAIADGADHLAELRDLVEDELIDALARARREEVSAHGPS